MAPLRKALFPALICIAAASGVPALAGQSPTAVETDDPIDEIVVVAHKFRRSVRDVAANVSVVSDDRIADQLASRPEDLFRYLPGVDTQTSGTRFGADGVSIRGIGGNRVKTLVDGVPVNDGFAVGSYSNTARDLVDVGLVRRIEVLRGPASALYGSDAIGGTVNVATQAPANDGLSGSLEGGSFGFGRALVSLGLLNGANGVRANLNVTRTDGWRDGTDYSRQSGVLRWDRQLSDASSLRTVAAFSHIDQSTAGSSAISLADYEQNPTVNYTPISFRKVTAFRLSSAYERLSETSLLSVTPFVRYNTMDILPNWSLTYDPGIWDTGNYSAGALVKFRRDFEPMRARLIAGADLDYSPGWHREDRIAPDREDGIFVDYTDGERIYDYDVSFHGVSPYLQAEASPIETVRITAGLRFDYLGYSYDNALGTEQAGAHRRPASTEVSYDHLSPKLGITFAPVEAFSLFGAYGHGFRAPSEGQLFRQGRALNTVDLSPVKADNLEAGARGLVGRFSYDVSVYRMEKTDDILTLTNPDGSTEASNAGSTLHRGIEIGAGAALPAGFRLDLAWSVMKHTYEEWRPRDGIDYSGNEMEDAPNQMGSANLAWSGLRDRLLLAVEWQHIGKYWMDADNTVRYPGHDLFNLRANVPVTNGVMLFGRLANLTDERYAESAAYTTARGQEYAPGLPRTVYLGVQVR